MAGGPMAGGPMAGETELASMLANLRATRRPGEFTFISVDATTPLPGRVDQLRSDAHAIVTEGEGITLVVNVNDALAAGYEVEPDAHFAWLSLDVHSSLTAVGLTAAVSTALANADISCNMLAGYFHDHLLVPAPLADTALAVIAALASSSAGGS